jgi:ParB family transcriptional regulator, chromosome partitioning protein
MQLVNLPLEQLKPAPWNANQMDNQTLAKLKESIRHFGFVDSLVVRKVTEESYEVLSGNQRLKLLTEMNYSQAPCVIVEMDDARARLLAQALNHLRGKDDLGLQAELMQEVLKTIPENEIMTVLPETAVSLMALKVMQHMETADYLRMWKSRQANRLRHMQFQFTDSQEETVEKALNQLIPEAKQNQGNSPNARSTAFYLLCKSYLERSNSDEKQ